MVDLNYNNGVAFDSIGSSFSLDSRLEVPLQLGTHELDAKLRTKHRIAIWRFFNGHHWCVSSILQAIEGGLK